MLFLALLLPTGNRARAKARADVLGKHDLGRFDALRTVEGLGRNLDLLQLHARQHPLEDVVRLERLEQDPNGDPALDVRAVIVLGLLRLHEARAQQSLCSPELHARRNALADLRDDLDLGMAL